MTTFPELVISEIQFPLGSSFFSKYWKLNADFKKAQKAWERVSCVWDNCIWIDIVKLSLLRTGYISSAANVLTSTPKIWHVNKREFFQFNFLASKKWIWSRCCDPDSNSAWESLPYCLSKYPLQRDFLDNYRTKYSESVISEIENLWGSTFFPKMVKI